MITNDANVHVTLNPRLPWEKAAFKKKKTLFTNKSDLSVGRN